MSQPFNASNQPGTCLWCGRKLKVFSLDQEPKHLEKTIALYTETGRQMLRQAEAERVRRVAKHGQRLGSYGDGFFCGLRCGYLFGVAFARDGKRLVKK